MKQPALTLPAGVEFIPLKTKNLEEEYEKYMDQLRKDIAAGLVLPVGKKKACRFHGI